jgi:hypothetical protein
MKLQLQPAQPPISLLEKTKAVVCIPEPWLFCASTQVLLLAIKQHLLSLKLLSLMFQ